MLRIKKGVHFRRHLIVYLLDSARLLEKDVSTVEAGHGQRLVKYRKTMEGGKNQKILFEKASLRF